MESDKFIREEMKQFSTDLGSGNSGTLSFKEQYGFELDPEKIKDIDRSKTLIPEVDMRKINDKDYIKWAKEKEKEVIEYLKGFAKEEEK
jgi:hypothetical protein